jgi:hypothetical protein
MGRAKVVEERAVVWASGKTGGNGTGYANIGPDVPFLER